MWKYGFTSVAGTAHVKSSVNGKPGKFFEPHYHIGLVHIAQNEWYSAKDDLLAAISFIQKRERNRWPQH